MEPMESPHKGKTGIRRLLNAFGYSCAGLREAFRNEDAFRQEVLLAGVLVPLAFVLERDMAARALMIGCVLLLLIVHRLAKRAKDIGSAAVLLSLVNLALVWALVLLR